MIPLIVLAVISCNGPGRYQLNREAYLAGKPEPCSTRLQAILDDAGRQCQSGQFNCNAFVAKPKE